MVGRPCSAPGPPVRGMLTPGTPQGHRQWSDWTAEAAGCLPTTGPQSPDRKVPYLVRVHRRRLWGKELQLHGGLHGGLEEAGCHAQGQYRELWRRSCHRGGQGLQEESREGLVPLRTALLSSPYTWKEQANVGTEDKPWPPTVTLRTGHPPQADRHRVPPEPRAGGPCALHPWEQSTVAPGSHSGSTELMPPGPRMRPPRGERSWCPPENTASLTRHVQAGSLSARGQLRSQAVPDVLVLGVEAAHGGVTGNRG